MTAGELFVNIGLKGAEKVGKGLSETSKAMGEVKETGIAAKLAILGIVYGLEQMMAASARTGVTMTNLGLITHMSEKTFQQLENASQRGGAAVGEATATVMNLQKILAESRVSGATDWMVSLGLDPAKIKDGQDFLNKLRDLARDPLLQGQFATNQVMKGLGATLTGVARKGNLNDDFVSKMPFDTDAQLKSLDQVYAKWQGISQMIRHAFDVFNSKHGNQLVNGVASIIPPLTHLVESLTTLAEKMKVFEWIGKTVQVMDWLANRAAEDVDLMNKGALNVPANEHGFFGAAPGRSSRIDMNKDQGFEMLHDLMESLKRGMVPQSGPGAKEPVRQTTMHNTFHIEEASDAKIVAQEIQRHINDAFYQTGDVV